MNRRKISRLSLILILCLGAAACSGSLLRNYGTINPHNEVTQAFEGYRVNSELRYYVSGALHYPNALMDCIKTTGSTREPSGRRRRG